MSANRIQSSRTRLLFFFLEGISRFSKLEFRYIKIERKKLINARADAGPGCGRVQEGNAIKVDAVV